MAETGFFFSSKKVQQLAAYPGVSDGFARLYSVRGSNPGVSKIISREEETLDLVVSESDKGGAKAAQVTRSTGTTRIWDRNHEER